MLIREVMEGLSGGGGLGEGLSTVGPRSWLRQLSYAIKNQLKACKMPFFMA